MAGELRLDIEPPSRGWAPVRLTTADSALDFAASYTPGDSIGDLACAALGLLAGLPEQVVIWSTEPVEYEFRFVTADGRTRLTVHEFPDTRRHRRGVETPIAVAEGDTAAIARALWSGLRRLQGLMPTPEFATAWRHPFPAATVEQLGDRLRNPAGQDGEVPHESIP